ncbi:hypothetical protein [Nocardioides sp. GXZ039]|uniref:hypothetical protein n=1 Tax=Nocardioides sp. GXZ039 TaxID=3136018 RepID=UPI0030F38E6A
MTTLSDTRAQFDRPDLLAGIPVEHPASAVHQVRVALTHNDRSTLLALASALHRRGVEVVAAELVPGADAPTFSATFLGTSAQADTVRLSLEGLIDVLTAELVDESPSAFSD